MDVRLFITGNFLCGECGYFLVPELERTSANAPTGRIFLTRHALSCSLRNKVLIAHVPEAKGDLKMLEEVPA